MKIRKTTIMTLDELYRLIRLPEGIINQLSEYETVRNADIPVAVRDKLFSRPTWDEGVKELQEYLDDDPYHMNILWEQLNLVCTYSHPEYVRRGIPMGIFADTFGFVTRFVSSTRDTYGKYSYNWAWWLPREITLQEFRIGALEYEFIDNEEIKEVGIHIPSDADMSIGSLRNSIMDFLLFEKKYEPDWVDTEMTTETWMIMPELEEFLPADSNILRFNHLFEIDQVDYDQTWYMGWIFPGYSDINEELPERTTLQRKLKEYLLAGKKFGIAKGHLLMDRVYSIP
ncbi:MAG: DUF5596 domain-containing protein [Lachnospiraceae bacterium]|nr:DUF5596 domain-containing protein [Lachnospiraceae bacterium]